jgi:hypothetical protein
MWFWLMLLRIWFLACVAVGHLLGRFLRLREQRDAVARLQYRSTL